MKPTWFSSRYARFDNGTCWPITQQHKYVDGVDSDAHRMRYMLPEQIPNDTRFYASDVISAYEHLLSAPIAHAVALLRALKAAERLRSESKRAASCGPVNVDADGREVEP